MHILLVEDDDLLQDGLSAGLRLAGHAVSVAGSAAQALQLAGQSLPELVILDLGLPDGEGLDVLATLREMSPDLLVMVLTARDSLHDRVRGLDAGADDYLVKPVALSELQARVRALARRREPVEEAGLRHGPLRMDLARHQASLAGQPLTLTPREWSLLVLFMRHPGELVSKDRLLTLLSGWEGDMTPNAVEVAISRLRAKLDPLVVIRTVRGFGYQLVLAESGA